jgi:hypothetical protein
MKTKMNGYDMILLTRDFKIVDSSTDFKQQERKYVRTLDKSFPIIKRKPLYENLKTTASANIHC